MQDPKEGTPQEGREEFELVDALELGTADSPVEITESGLTLNLGGDTPSEEVVERPIIPVDWAALAELEAQWLARPQDDSPNPSLARIEMLMDLLGEPNKAFSVIHVAGTNGKSSTARMVDSLLRSFHRRVGLFTTPKLSSSTNCIVIDGQEIHPADLVERWEEIRPYVEMVDAHFASQGAAPLSYFEVLVGLAYASFADAPVDIAVIEVGMGGTWDATNVVNAEVSVVTPIGLEHQGWLGQTLPEIAAHKAGIIKPRAEEENFAAPAENIAVIAPQEPEAMKVLLEAAVAADAAVARQGREFAVAERAVAVGGQMLQLKGLGGEYPNVFLPLSGPHQAANASLALAAVEAFFGVAPGKTLDVDSVRAGFAQVAVPGRMERIKTDPIIFADSAHNPHGVASLVDTLRQDFHFQGIVGVIGVLRDKNARDMLLQLEPVFTDLIVTEPTSPRAMPAEELAELAYDIFGDDRVRVSSSLIDAVDQAIGVVEDTEEDGWGVVITGSVTTAAQARAMFL